MNWAQVLAVAAAGSAGALARVLVDNATRSRRPSSPALGTILVNVTGSLLVGALTGLVMFHRAPSDVQAIAGTGFCGGYTTFSAASFETVRLFRRGDLRAAFAQSSVTLLGSLGAAALGLVLASL